jgi:hypothetical protein
MTDKGVWIMKTVGLMSVIITFTICLVCVGSGRAELTTYELTFDSDDLSFTRQGAYDVVGLDGYHYLSRLGEPMLPLVPVRIAVPTGKQVVDVRILTVDEVEVPGSYHILPAQPPQPIGREVRDDFVLPDPDIYLRYAIYPSAQFESGRARWLGPHRILGLRVYPLRYNPVEKRIFLARRLVLGLELAVEHDQPQRSGSHVHTRMARSLVVNPQDVREISPVRLNDATVEYLLITGDDYVDDFQPLADWKTRKGVPVEILSTSWIYANYSGVDEQEMIRNCIIDYHQNHGTEWVLLGGDAEVVPYRGCYAKVGWTRDEGIPCDLYYSDLDGDWNFDGDLLWGEVADSVDLLPEVFVGRAVVDDPYEVETFIHKVLTYEGEQNHGPLPLDYQLDMLFIGEMLDAETSGGDAKDTVQVNHVPGRFTVEKIYERDGTLDYTSCMTHLNRGYNIINHNGHANIYVVSIGPHALYSVDMENLTNGPHYSLLYTQGCSPGAFDFDCFGEHYLTSRYGGGPAFFGNSRYGWYSPGWPGHGPGDLYDNDFFHCLFSKNSYQAGETLGDSKATLADQAEEDGAMRWTQFCLNLFGDPELPIWTDIPESLQVSYLSSIPPGGQSFEVDVQSGGSPLGGARVCLWKGEEVYEVGWTDGSGHSTLQVDPASEGEMWITVTAQDHVPYQGSVSVTSCCQAGTEDEGKAFQFCMRSIYPNPFVNDATFSYEIPTASRVVIDIYNAAGQRVRRLIAEEPPGRHQMVWDGRNDVGQPLSPGVYFCRVSAGHWEDVRKVVLMK